MKPSTNVRLFPKAKTTTRSRRHHDHPKGRTQPLVGRPLDEHPVWEKLRLVLLTVTAEDLDGLPGRFEEAIRWGHALMRAPHWQNARKGRKALNDLRDRFADTVRFANDVAVDSYQHAVAV